MVQYQTMARGIENGPKPAIVREKIITSPTQYNKFRPAQEVFDERGERVTYHKENTRGFPPNTTVVTVTAPSTEILYRFFKTARELNQQGSA